MTTNTRQLSDMAALYNALGSRNRLRIALMLLGEPMTVTEIVEAYGGEVSMPYISAQLALLQRSGIVAYEHSGRYHIYHIASQDVEALLEVAREAVQR